MSNRYRKPTLTRTGDISSSGVPRPLDWKNLHPAPRVEVPEKNCCDCIFRNPTNKNCTIHSKIVGDYDECGAFTKKSDKSEDK